jgi:hypothetical protein
MSVEDKEYNPEEYIPLADLLPGDRNIIRMVNESDILYKDLAERIKFKVEVEIKKILKKTKKDIPGETVATLIDSVGIFYERIVTIGNTKILVLPLMQLVARSDLALWKTYSDPKYAHLSRERRNEFLAALACELFGAAMLKVYPESDFVPTMATVIDSGFANKKLYIKCPEYIYQTVEDEVPQPSQETQPA